MHTISQNPGHTIEVSPLTAGTFTLTSKDTLDATLTVTTPGTPINPTAATAAIGSSYDTCNKYFTICTKYSWCKYCYN